MSLERLDMEKQALYHLQEAFDITITASTPPETAYPPFVTSTSCYTSTASSIFSVPRLINWHELIFGLIHSW